MDQAAKNIDIHYSEKVRDSSSDSGSGGYCGRTSDYQGCEIYKKRLRKAWKIKDPELCENK